MARPPLGSTPPQDLHALVGRLAALCEEPEIAEGPRHPERPKPELGAETAAWLAEHPFLRRDAGYVEYLECYSGIFVDRYDPETQIDVFGFGDGTFTHLVHGDGDPIDKEGFMPFAAVNFTVGGPRSVPGSRPRSMSFGFDTTGARPWGVYRHYRRSWEPYCGTFLEWLERLLDAGGLPVEGLDLLAQT